MYQILWANTNDPMESHTQNVSDPLRTHAVVTGLRNGQSYVFRVRARNEAGFGRWSLPSDDVFVVPGEFDVPPRVVLGSDMAGATTTFTLQMVPSASIPNDGAIQVRLPKEFVNVTAPTIERFEVDGIDFAALSSIRVRDATNVTVTRDGTGPEIEAYASVNITVSTLQNPWEKTKPDATGVFPVVRTEESNGDPIDEASERFNRGRRAPGVVIIPAAYIRNVTIAGGRDGLPTQGGVAVTLTGRRFGPTSNGAIRATYGAAGTEYKAQNCTCTRAELEIVCYAAPGAGADHVWRVTVEGGVWSKFSEDTTSYYPPSVDQIVTPLAGRQLDTRGGETITVVGNNFGPAYADVDTVVYGDDTQGYAMTSTCTMTKPHTELTCTTPAGVGRDYRLNVTTDGQLSLCNNTVPRGEADPGDCLIHYKRPNITAVAMYAGKDGASISTLSTAGNDTVVLTGDFFGEAAVRPKPAAAYTNLDEPRGLSGRDYQIGACEVTVAHTEVTCRTLPGVGTDHEWRVVIGKQVSAPSRDLTGYTRPDIVSFNTEAKLPLGLATDGSDEVTLTGTNFGPPGPGNNVTAEFYSTRGLRGLAGVSHTVRCTVRDHTEAVCETPVGTGFDQRWKVTVGSQVSVESPVDEATSYATPVIASIAEEDPDETDLHDLLTAGGEYLLLTGTDFGPIDPANNVTAMYHDLGLGTNGQLATAKYNVSCEVVVAHTTARCPTLPGVGFNHSWLVYVGGQSSDIAVGYETSYAPPAITGINHPIINTDGTDNVTLIGTNFGPVDTTNFISAEYERPWHIGGEAQYLYTGVCTVIVPNVRMACTTSPGVGKGFAWTIDVGGQLSAPSTPLLTRYQRPVIEALSGAVKLRTEGAETITLSGSHFGPLNSILNVTYSNTDLNANGAYVNLDLASITFRATACNVTVAHVEAECATAPGVGKEHYWTLAVGNQSSDRSPRTTSYRKPEITGFNAEAVDSPGLSTGGGEDVTITGTNFGPPRDENVVNATYRSPGLEGTAGDRLTASGCEVHSHTRIVCVAASGSGKEHHWRIYVGGQPSNLSAAYTSYAPPTITGFGNASVHPFGMSTRGGEAVTIVGVNFGEATDTGVYANYWNRNLTGLAGQKYNATECAVTVDHVEIVCTTAEGVGFNQSWLVDIGKLKSVWSTAKTDYARPEITNLGEFASTAGLLTVGGEAINITGTDFGPVTHPATTRHNLVSVNYRNTDYSATDKITYAGYIFPAANCSVTVAHTVITCVTVPGVGYNHLWKATVGQQESPYSYNVARTRYATPVITSFETIGDLGDVFHTRGGGKIRLVGENFGPLTGGSGGARDNIVYAKLSNDKLPGLPGDGVMADCNVTVSQ